MKTSGENIIGIAPLSRENVVRLGSSLKKLYRIEDVSDFDDLLKRLHKIDARLRAR